MTHEEATLLVADLDAGRLEPEKEAAVRAHLVDCAECSGLSEAYRVVAAALRLDSGHPGAADLVAHVTGASLEAELETHLAACPSCSRQAAAIRAAEAELSKRRIPTRVWIGWAAVVALPLLMGYVGWLELRVLPGMRDALERAQGGTAAPSETVSLPLLSPATRGGEEPVEVPVRSGQRSIAVAVAPALPRDLDDREALRIEVRSGDGSVVYSRSTTAGELRGLLGKSGAFALVLPVSGLPAGDATLYIHAASRGELLAAAFRVRRG